ncbi:MAG TPA: response regulator transcription factor [Fusibacter sp.]|nr:response regulator transcription factor [Fusibacter sp.]
MTILLVDDDPIVCLSLKTIIEADPTIEVVATGSNGHEAIERFQQHKPDLLLIDIRMPELNGLEAAEAILRFDPDAKILFLTTFSDDEYIIKALRIGAKGYLLKQHFDRIVPSIKTVLLGQNVYGDEIMTRLPELLIKNSKMATAPNLGLSEKEFQIIEKVSEGLSNKEISDTLFLSEGTVRNYISAILEKLELRDRTQLAIFYYQNMR